MKTRMVQLRTVSFPLWICPSRAALLIEKTTSQTNSQENQIAILVSAERGEPEYPEKNLSEQNREPNLTAGKEPSQLVLVLEAKSQGRYRRGDRPIIKSVLYVRDLNYGVNWPMEPRDSKAYLLNIILQKKK